MKPIIDRKLKIVWPTMILELIELIDLLLQTQGMKLEGKSSEEIWMTINEYHDEVKDKRKEIINEVNEKIKVMQGSTKHLKFKVIDQGVIQQVRKYFKKQIENILKDSDRLIKRTQQNRSFNPSDPPINNRIFDDTDFYQQLLKDILSVKRSSTEIPVIKLKKIKV